MSRISTCRHPERADSESRGVQSPSSRAQSESAHRSRRRDFTRSIAEARGERGGLRVRASIRRQRTSAKQYLEKYSPPTSLGVHRRAPVAEARPIPIFNPTSMGMTRVLIREFRHHVALRRLLQLLVDRRRARRDRVWGASAGLSVQPTRQRHAARRTHHHRDRIRPARRARPRVVRPARAVGQRLASRRRFGDAHLVRPPRAAGGARGEGGRILGLARPTRERTWTVILSRAAHAFHKPYPGAATTPTGSTSRRSAARTWSRSPTTSPRWCAIRRCCASTGASDRTDPHLGAVPSRQGSRLCLRADPGGACIDAPHHWRQLMSRSGVPRAVSLAGVAFLTLYR